MVDIQNLKKRYGNKTVLDIPRLQIKKGERFGLLGNNGAGKTTLFRLMLDLIQADDGWVCFKGNHCVTRDEDWKATVGAYLDEDFLIDFYTPEEFFRFVARFHALSEDSVRETLRSFEAFFNGKILQSGKLIRHLSSGNRHKVGIASAFLAHPEIVILDEPFNLIDPRSQHILETFIKEYNRTYPATIIISSNILHPLLNCSDRIVLLEDGGIIKDRPVSDDTIRELEGYFGDDSV